MKNLIDTVETTMAAAAFAEAGEFETAREIMREDRSRKNVRPANYETPRPAQRKELRVD